MLEQEPWTLFKFIEFLLAIIVQLLGRLEELEARINQNSSNSNKPPSSDSPYRKQKKPQKEEVKKTKEERRSRKGSRQQLLEPTDVTKVHPTRCECGSTEFEDQEPYYTHQHIELPEIVMRVLHFELFKGRCRHCGKTVKGHVPPEYRTGYGPRLSARIAESEKGCRWVERILSLRQTCRLQGGSSFATLVEAMTCYFTGQQPDLQWIRSAASQ